MAKKKNYVNNKDLLAALIEYKSKCVEAEESGEKNPQVPDYIGKCIMLIAQRLSTRPNFSGYMYKEEMVSDGIENCLQYIHNFNPEKSKNPFAYFTQITYYAFIRRIQKEKRQMETKFKYIKSLDIEQILNDSADGTEHSNDYLSYMRNIIEQAEADNAKADKANEGKKDDEVKEGKDEDEVKEAKDEDEANESIDIDALIAEIESELEEGKDEKEVKEADDAELEEAKKRAKKAEDELEEALAAVSTLKESISEMNLLNSKLLYCNKLFKANSLTEAQKVKVVDALDLATTANEAKLVFSTLQESFNFTGVEKRAIKEGLGRASKASGTAPKKVIAESVDGTISRFQKLANIKF